MWDEPLGPTTQCFQALRPDVSADSLLTHFEEGGRLGDGMFMARSW